jgi:hypothetical protein
MQSIQFPFQYARLNRTPIDESYVFANMAAFTTYLASGPAYAGQIVAVRNATNEPQLFRINEDFTFEELGSGNWVDTSNPAMTHILTRVTAAFSPASPHELVRLDDLASLTGEPNYSLTPVNTFRRWVDGSQVFRRAWIGQTGTPVGTLNQVGEIADFAGLVRLDGYLVGGDGYRVPINHNRGGTNYFAAMIHEEGTLWEQHGVAAYSDRRMIIVLDYIPTPADLTVWDSGTTSWDDGATVWDQI